MIIRKLRSKVYGEAIEVRCPIRFYWNKDGSFDGIELGPFRGGLTQYQIRLISHLLNRIGEMMPEKAVVPKPFLQAFEEKTRGED